MSEVGTSGSMSRAGKRSDAEWAQATAPILDSTETRRPDQARRVEYLTVARKLAKRAKHSIIMAHCSLPSLRMLVIFQEIVFAVIFATSAVSAADFLMWLLQAWAGSNIAW